MAFLLGRSSWWAYAGVIIGGVLLWPLFKLVVEED